MKSNRQLAIAAGEKTYHGRPCKHCQETLKSTNGGSCVICKAAHTKKWKQKNPEKVSARYKKWYQKNSEKVSARNKKWCENNKEKKAAINKNWQQNNKDKKNANTSKYRAIKNSPRNKLLFELFAPEIKSLYAKAEQLASDTNIPHHVHHYIPLARGGTNSISNLYVIPDTWNLQIGSKDPNKLTSKEDIKLREQILNYKC